MEKLINGWKVGDKIRCIYELTDFTVGYKYTIESINVKDNYFIVRNDYCYARSYTVDELGCWWDLTYQEHKLFELVEEQPFQWRNIKFRTPTEEIYKAVQLEAFKNGCKWASGGTKIQYENCGFIYIDGLGNITMDRNCEYVFHNKPYQEIQVQVEYKFVPVVEPVKEVIEFDGQKYYKEDYLAAIESLKKLSLGEVK